MFFTREDILKIQAELARVGVRDSEFSDAYTPLNNDDILVLSQNGKNTKIRIQDFLEQLHLLSSGDFLNVTTKFDASHITLEEAIRIIPYRSRKVGLTITFQNVENKWEIWQYTSPTLNQWNILSVWEVCKIPINSIAVPDEEDLTIVSNDDKQLIQFKDKSYDPKEFSGKGRVYLRKNITEIQDVDTGKLNSINLLTQEMINQENTIYIIQYDYDLNRETITIPANCVLRFDGGKISNGTLIFNNTNIEASNYHIFQANLQGSLCNSLIPNWFGAIGDGVSDDTEALRNTIISASTLRCMVEFPNNFVYKVSGPLNYYDGEYKSITLNLKGFIPEKLHVYTPDGWGGIKMEDNTNLFQGATITGSITSLIIVGVRSEQVHVFDNCKCKYLSILNSTISNVGAVFFDSSLNTCSRIGNNVFLTAFYFHRNDRTNSGLTDSNIYNNYINGGAELTDNSCFEFSNYNGSLIYGNFIDYYRTIYEAKATVKQSGGCINSQNNQYQVFRYFWIKKNIVNLSISSVGDCFNWNDPGKLEKLTTFQSEIYTGRDGSEYNLPPHIVRIEDITNVSFINSVFEANIRNILYIKGDFFNYDNTFIFESPLVSSGSLVPILPEGGDLTIYNGGHFKYKFINLPDNSADEVQSLPNISTGWSNRMVGQKVLYNGIMYVAEFIYDANTSSYKAQWTPMRTNLNKIPIGGTEGQILKIVLGKPTWVDPS